MNLREIHGYIAEVFYVENDDTKYAGTVYRSMQYPTQKAALDAIKDDVFELAAIILDEEVEEVASHYDNAESDSHETVIKQIDDLKQWIDTGFSEENPIDPLYDGRICEHVAYVEAGLF